MGRESVLRTRPITCATTTVWLGSRSAAGHPKVRSQARAPMVSRFSKRQRVLLAGGLLVLLVVAAARVSSSDTGRVARDAANRLAVTSGALVKPDPRKAALLARASEELAPTPT